VSAGAATTPARVATAAIRRSRHRALRHGVNLVTGVRSLRLMVTSNVVRGERPSEPFTFGRFSDRK
jgi:hypothetical protein